MNRGKWTPAMWYDTNDKALKPMVIRQKDTTRPVSRYNYEIYRECSSLDEARMLADELNLLRKGEA